MHLNSGGVLPAGVGALCLCLSLFLPSNDASPLVRPTLEPELELKLGVERVDRQGAYARLGGKLYPGAVQPQKMSVAGAEGYSDNTCAMRELRLLLTVLPRPTLMRLGHERAALIRIHTRRWACGWRCKEGEVRHRSRL